MQLPAAGATCAFTFTNEFTSLNGIYTVTSIQTFANALENGVNFLTSLYAPAGLTQENYNADWQNYQNSQVLELTNVVAPNAVIYAPAPIIALMPDPTVKQYTNLAIGMILGVFDQVFDEVKLQWLLDEVSQLVQSVTGVSNSAQFMSPSSVWMTEAAYKTLVAERQQNIHAVLTSYAALQAQIAINNQLKTIIAYYENTFKQLQFSSPSGQ